MRAGWRRAGVFGSRSEIDEFDFRESARLHALAYFEQAVAPLAGIFVAFDRGGGGAEDDRATQILSPDHRNIAAIVTRSLILFVGGIMLFIDDDQAEFRQRRKNRRARTNHHVDLGARNTAPLIDAFFAGESAVQDADPAGKARFKAIDQLRC